MVLHLLRGVIPPRLAQYCLLVSLRPTFRSRSSVRSSCEIISGWTPLHFAQSLVQAAHMAKDSRGLWRSTL